jgi:hypothetical protein
MPMSRRRRACALFDAMGKADRLRPRSSGSGRVLWELPARPGEMARLAVRIAL